MSAAQATSQTSVSASAGTSAGTSASAPANAPASVAVSASAGKEIARQRDKRGTPNSAIRIGLRGGGCTGFSYMFEWDDGEPRATDHVIREHGVLVYIDPKSLVYLQGTELDFVTSMMGHGFKFNNPNVTGECGCGESVQF